MIILLNKPFDVLCQFTGPQDRPTLAAFVKQPDVYPAGRLDADSEGLLVLTDDGALSHRLTDPQHKLAKTYLAQIEGAPREAQLERLRRGVMLNDGPAAVVGVKVLAKAPGWLWTRDPPVRFRKHIATHWLELSISEGRNRQVRRMTAAVGLPTLRLVRLRVGPYELGTLAPGESRIVDTLQLQRRSTTATMSISRWCIDQRADGMAPGLRRLYNKPWASRTISPATPRPIATPDPPIPKRSTTGSLRNAPPAMWCGTPVAATVRLRWRWRSGSPRCSPPIPAPRRSIARSPIRA
jgi:23S rRNA pseudouridine2457 synthase